MRLLVTALAASMIGTGIPAVASAEPVFLDCNLTREVANPSSGVHVSMRLHEWVKIDPDARLFAESGKDKGPWINQCVEAGYQCRFDQKAYTVTAQRRGVSLKTSIDRASRKYRSEGETDNLLSLSYGACTDSVDPDTAGAP